MLRKQAACKRLASTSFRRQLLSKLLVQGWRGSSGNVHLSHLLMSFLYYTLQTKQPCRHTYTHCHIQYVFTYLTAWRCLQNDLLCVECNVNPLPGTLKPQSNGPLVHYTAIRWLVHWPAKRGWAGCGPAQSLIAVPNVTAHPSTASVPTLYYSMWHYSYSCTLANSLHFFFIDWAYYTISSPRRQPVSYCFQPRQFGCLLRILWRNG